MNINSLSDVHYLSGSNGMRIHKPVLTSFHIMVTSTAATINSVNAGFDQR